MCSFEFVLCSVLDCVMCSVRSIPSSLRSENASFRSGGRMNAYIYSKLVNTTLVRRLFWADFRQSKK